MAKITQIRIHTEYITLGQFLKFTGIITDGFEAKLFLQENDVVVNGELENRRGRKLYPRDLIEVDGQKYSING